MQRRLRAGAAVLVALVSATPALALRAAAHMPHTPEPRGLHDFDFLIGEWTIRSRRLAARLAGSTEWHEHEGRAVMHPLLDGLVNVDEVRFPGQDFSGSSVRVLNRATGEWSIYWISARDGILQPPVTGRFEAGVGIFQGDDVHDGRPIRVRYIWSHVTERGARWQQAFSTDDGRTWETNWVMDLSRVGQAPTPSAAADETCCPVVELRQYAMKPGRRDDLIALFDARFVESQEQHGMRIVGQFRQTGQPDRFVWLRGFADMAARRAALEGFYGGPVWSAHRAAANDTMEDVSNVLLLRPARRSTGFRLRLADRDRAGGSTSVVTATIYALKRPADDTFLELFETALTPSFRAAGARLLGTFVTEPAANTFPRLPVREGESMFVWLASFPDANAHAAFERTLAVDPEWGEQQKALDAWFVRQPETLRLTPTSRSLLR